MRDVLVKGLHEAGPEEGILVIEKVEEEGAIQEEEVYQGMNEKEVIQESKEIQEREVCQGMKEEAIQEKKEIQEREVYPKMKKDIQEKEEIQEREVYQGMKEKEAIQEKEEIQGIAIREIERKVAVPGLGTERVTDQEAETEDKEEIILPIEKETTLLIEEGTTLQKSEIAINAIKVLLLHPCPEKSVTREPYL